ncbi:MAG TPA: hypothetical protein VNO21_02225 [Polyangiaceae bacterium]|nr:hypothetical protein [Polyangiaceae bacterium]
MKYDFVVRIGIVAIAGFTSFSLIGCATANGLRELPVAYGEPRVFTSDYTAVVKAARTALTDEDLSIEDDHAIDEHTWMLIGHDSGNLASWGGYIRLIVDRQDNGVYVRLSSQKAMATNVTARDDYRDLFDRISAKLPRTASVASGTTPAASAPATSVAPGPAASTVPPPVASAAPVPP